jgi:hypothetical protein
MNFSGCIRMIQPQEKISLWTTKLTSICAGMLTSKTSTSVLIYRHRYRKRELCNLVIWHNNNIRRLYPANFLHPRTGKTWCGFTQCMIPPQNNIATRPRFMSFPKQHYPSKTHISFGRSCTVSMFLDLSTPGIFFSQIPWKIVYYHEPTEAKRRAFQSALRWQ